MTQSSRDLREKYIDRAREEIYDRYKVSIDVTNKLIKAAAQELHHKVFVSTPPFPSIECTNDIINYYNSYGYNCYIHPSAKKLVVEWRM